MTYTRADGTTLRNELRPPNGRRVQKVIKPKKRRTLRKLQMQLERLRSLDS